MNIGQGLIKLPFTEIAISEFGPWPSGRTNSAGFPIGSGSPAATALLWDVTVWRNPARSKPALAATSSSVSAWTRSAPQHDFCLQPLKQDRLSGHFSSGLLEQRVIGKEPALTVVVLDHCMADRSPVTSFIDEGLSGCVNDQRTQEGARWSDEPPGRDVVEAVNGGTDRNSELHAAAIVCASAQLKPVAIGGCMRWQSTHDWQSSRQRAE